MKIHRFKKTVHHETLYKKLVEHMNEGMWLGDKSERTVYANPKFCKMVEHPLSEIIGCESYDFWDRESAKKVRHVNTTDRKRGISSSYEGILVSRTGKRIPVLLSGTPLPDGGTIGIMTDLTELKKKQNIEKILNTAIHYATDAIITFNEGGVVESWNKGAKMIFGYEREEMLGVLLDKIFPESDMKLIMNVSEILYNVELHGLNKNATECIISATINPIRDTDGTIHYLFIGRDITHESKIQEELAVKYQKLKEAYNKFGIIKRQMDYLFDLLELFGGTNDKKSMADFIVTSIIMLTRVDACVLRLFNPVKNVLDLISFFGVDEDWRGKATIKYKGSLVEKAFKQREPLKIIDVTKESRYQSSHLAKKSNLCSLLLIPLEFRSKLVGSLSLYARPEKKLEIFENEFTEKYAKLIQVLVGTMF